MERSWLDAIKKVLTETEASLHYTEISEQVLSRGYYVTDGATPASTVNALITSSIKHDGERSPFIRVGRGTFALRDSASTTSQSVLPVKRTVPEPIADLEVESSDSIIQSFGMYWQRDLVVWRGEPRVYGKQQALSKAVDFGKQKGIYVLYDQHTVIDVGRCIDRPLGRRLYEHTVDRLVKSLESLLLVWSARRNSGRKPPRVAS